MPYAPAYGYPQPWAVVRPGPAPGLVYAGFWIRVGAWLIDLLVYVGIAFAVGTFINLLPASGTAGAVVAALLSVAWLLAWLTLQIGIPGRYGGTIGMRAVGLWIVREQDGSQIGYALAAGRFGVTFALAAVTLGAGGIADAVLVAFDKRKQAIHDKACATLVIRKAS
jgi:uncharacterized RDD family membrane protein YckC